MLNRAPADGAECLAKCSRRFSRASPFAQSPQRAKAHARTCPWLRYELSQALTLRPPTTAPTAARRAPPNAVQGPGEGGIGSAKRPHRLAVRTSRCGRDNPGLTPGVVIFILYIPTTSSEQGRDSQIHHVPVNSTEHAFGILCVSPPSSVGRAQGS